MAPKDRGPPPSPDGPGTRLWSECARSADSESPRNPWVSWGGEHRSTPLSNAHAGSADPGSPRNRRFRGGGRPGVPAKSQISWVGDGPGKGAPTQWGCNGPHPGPPRSLIRGVDPGPPRSLLRGVDMRSRSGDTSSTASPGPVRTLKASYQSLDLRGERVLVREDLNVPLQTRLSPKTSAE